jgi:hypothetical protein
MKNAYLDATQIHDYQDNSLGFVIEPGIQGLESAKIRLPVIQKPNADGAIVPNHLYGERLITFSGKIWADTAVDYRTRRRAFESATAIKRDSSGKRQPIIFKFTTDDDLELQVEAYLKEIDFPDTYMMHGKYRLDLLAPTYQMVGQELINRDIFVFQGGGFAIPFAIPLSMAANGGALTAIVNAGNAIAYPFYRLTGPLTNPTFTNTTTGEQFSLTYTLSSGELIEIDTVTHSVVHKVTIGATPTNIRDDFSGDFVTLDAGTNQVKLTNTTLNTGFISVIYRDSYSGT